MRAAVMKQQYSIYELLAKIRARPAVHLGVWSLVRLQAFLHGYSFMASELGIEPCDQSNFGGFHDWVAARFGWPESTAGWCNIILQECGGDDRKALESFFVLIDEYRKSSGLTDR
jgi:hypothetical protein